MVHVCLNREEKGANAVWGNPVDLTEELTSGLGPWQMETEELTKLGREP